MADISMGIIFGLIAMLGYGLGNALTQVPVREIGERRTAFFRNSIISLMLFVILVAYLPESNFSLEYIAIAFVISFIGFIPMISFYKALKLGKVGVVAPIGSSSVVFTILLSIIFFGEVLSAAQIISMAAIVAGILLISVNFRDLRGSDIFRLSSGVPYAIVACILWGLVYFLFKIPVSVLGPILTSFIIEFGVLISSWISLKMAGAEIGKPDPRMWRYIFAIAILMAMGTLFYNIGVKSYDVSIISAITFSSPIVSTLYARFAYKERISALQWFAVMLILAGIVLLAI